MDRRFEKHRSAGTRLLVGYVSVVNGNGRTEELAIHAIEPTSLDADSPVIGGAIRDRLPDDPFHSRLL